MAGNAIRQSPSGAQGDSEFERFVRWILESGREWMRAVTLAQSDDEFELLEKAGEQLIRAVDLAQSISARAGGKK